MSSYDYWKEREEAQRKKDNKDMKSYSTEIKKIYQNMMDQISDEIYAFYSKYASDTGITMAEAIKRANKLDMEEYSRKAKKYVEEKNFSEQANAEMKLYNMTMKVNRLELLKANIGLELVSGHDELEKFFQEELENKTIEEIERLAGILGDSIQNNKEFAESIVNASFHNATFSDRIWMHQDLLKNDISSLLQTGLIQGRNPNVLARDLRKRFNVKISDAERLMRTEMARVQVDAQMRSYLANGIDEYEYIACGGSDVCSICRAMDGKVFKVSKMVPAKNAPPMHPNCHCSTGAHIDDKDYENWLSFIESGGTTKEWNVLKKSAAIQITKNSGAIYGAWNDLNDPHGTNREEIADKLYNQIRNRKKEFEIKAVSDNSGFELEDVSIIYDHVFINKHNLEEGIERFNPDYYMAHSWMRLREGKQIQKHDITMLNHELEEALIEKRNPGITYIEAHRQAEAKYNYSKELLEYLKEHDV